MATAVIRTFEIYQKARIQFVQTVAELAKRKENYEALQGAGVLLLLRPLLLDVVPSVSQTACIAIGRLAENSVQVAQDIIAMDILPDIFDSIPQQNRFFKKCAAFVIKNIANHNKALAQEVVKANGLQALANILSEFDPSVKEAACWAISYIAKQGEELATQVTEHIPLKDLVLCIQEPELGLRQIACYALMEIAKHKIELAKVAKFDQKLASQDESNLLPFLGPLIYHSDSKLQRQAIACLSAIAYHSSWLADQVVSYIKFEKLLNNLKHEDRGVRRNSADCIKNIVRHSADSCKVMSTKDNTKPLIEYIRNNPGPDRESALVAISRIAHHDENLAMILLQSGAVPILRDALVHEKDARIKQWAATALGELGNHSEEHGREIARQEVLKELKEIMFEETQKGENKNVELLRICKEANSKIIAKCKEVEPLFDLIDQKSSNDLLALVLKQILKIIPSNSAAKRKFAETGGLKQLLELKEMRGKPGTGSEKTDQTIDSIIDDICKQYPKAIVNYYTPNFEKKIAEQLDNFKHQSEA